MAELNPFASFAQGRRLAMERRAEERLIEDREREAASRNRMAQLFAGGMPTTPEAQRRVVGEIAQTDPAQARDWSKHFSGMETERLKRRQAEAPFMVAQMSGVEDQAGYDRARANLANLGVDAADMPDVYDPAQVNMVVQAARYLAEGPPEAPQAGPYRGDSQWAQDRNVLLTADPRSPEYAASYAGMAAPRRIWDAASGQMIQITPDMSPYARPIGQGESASTEASARREELKPVGPPGTGVKVTEGKPTMRPTNVPGMTVMPLPGTKAERDIAKEEEAKKSRDAQKKAYARVVTQDIDRIFDLMEGASLPVTGFVGSRVSAIPGTAAHDIASLLDTVRANIGFDRLQQMRAASPTGGALGQVSEMENRLLQSTFGALNQSQTEDQFRRNLNRLKDYYSKIVLDGMSPAEIEEELSKIEGQEVERQPSAAAIAPTPTGEPPEVSTKEQYDALPAGAEYRAPDGVLRIKR